MTRSECAHRIIERTPGLKRLAKKTLEGLGDERIGVMVRGQRIPLEDDDCIPDHLRGHIQLALDLNLVSPELRIEDDCSGSGPSLTAWFHPGRKAPPDWPLPLNHDPDENHCNGIPGRQVV